MIFAPLYVTALYRTFTLAMRAVGSKFNRACHFCTFIGIAVFASSCSQDSEKSVSVEDWRGYTNKAILRLDLDMHHSSIERADISADHRVFVTAARDNTIKLWNADDFALLKTIRPPIKSDFLESPASANLNAVTITPDGAEIAAAGVVDLSNTSRVYVFNSDGALLATPFEEPSNILEIEYSDSGRYLAFGVSDAQDKSLNGLWVFERGNWATPILRDADYEAPIEGIAFSHNNQLAVTSYDGFLRLYSHSDSGLQQAVKTKAPGGDLPHEIDFHPDGTKLVVGYKDAFRSSEGLTADGTHRIEILDSSDLSVIGRPSLRAGRGIQQNENMSASRVRALTWSANGEVLFANISFPSGQAPDDRIRRWRLDDYESTYQDYDTCENLNTNGILPYGDAGAIITFTDPCFRVIDGSGAYQDRIRKLNAFRSGDSLLPSVNMQDFLVSQSGGKIYLFDYESRRSALFDLSTRNVVDYTGREAPSDMDGFTDNSSGLEFENWQEGYEPKLNGELLPYFRNQRSGLRDQTYSVDVANSGAYAMHGTRFALIRYSIDREVEWIAASTEWTQRVNITPDERIVVSEYQDGTMVWHDAKTGRLLLSLYLHTDLSRWVLWTVEGYFDASHGAEDFIGWHVNQGPDSAAEFSKASRHRKQFLNTDIIDATVRYINGELNTLEELDAAIEIAKTDNAGVTDIRASLKPIISNLTVDIVEKRDRPHLKVSFHADGRTGGHVNSVKISIDGRTVHSARPKWPRRNPSKFRVLLPFYSGDEELRIAGANQQGMGTAAIASIRQTVEGQFAGRGTRGAVRLYSSIPDSPRQNIYAVLVGVNDYSVAPNFADLCCAINDIKEIGKRLERQSGTPYFENVYVTELAARNATREKIINALKDMQRVSENDLVILYFAGHGLVHRNNYYFIPTGSNGRTDTLFGGNAIAGYELQAAIEAMDASTFVFLDTCHSARAFNRVLVNNLDSGSKRVIIYNAAGNDQAALENRALGHGAFTKALLEAMDSEPTASYITDDGVIYTDELGTFLRNRVREITDNRQQVGYNHPYWHGMPISDEFLYVPRTESDVN